MVHEPEPILNEDTGPVNRIRVETSFSRYPIHQLAKAGTISINLQGQDTTTEAPEFFWRISSNKEYGHPGPLTL